ncbi:MAG: ABC transporter permease [Blastocatellia bacterium]|nr:ABC transporter permease [Blastocatellia bacterium]
MRRINLIDSIVQDVRYGLRIQLKNPGFTFIAVLTLSLGVGANTAIFSLIDATLLRMLPVRKPEQLLLFGAGHAKGIAGAFPKGRTELFSYPFYQDVRRRNQVFSDVTAVMSLPSYVHGVVSGTGNAEIINAQLVSGTYFSTLGVNAILGRTFIDADDQVSGGHPVVVVNHTWWERRLSADPAAVGKTIAIGSTVYSIIGVAPPEFFGTEVGESPDIWIPLAMEERIPPGWKGLNDNLFQSLHIIGRMKPGLSIEQSNAEANLLFKQALREYAGSQPSPERLSDIQQASVELTPAGRGLSQLRISFSRPLQVLMVVVGLVLLIACANIANLLLARGAERRKEFAVRLALGASRLRLIRQLGAECLWLAAIGGVLGALNAWWGSQVLVWMASAGPHPLPLNVTPNARVLCFTLLASLLSVVVFGMVPALRITKFELGPVLKGGSGDAARSLLGKALVVSQVALSLLLLVGAGLFVRSLFNLRNVDAGFDQRNVLLFKLLTDSVGYRKDDPRLANLYREVEEKVYAIPGVRAASFSLYSFNQGSTYGPISVSGGAPPLGGNPVILNNVVSPGFFTTMNLPLILGRAFGPQDTKRSPKVAVISEEMARRFFPNESPLGKRYHMGTSGEGDEIEVIGVVKDAKYRSLNEKVQPMAYYSYSQQNLNMYLGNFEVSFSGESGAIAAAVRRALNEVNVALPIFEVAKLSEQVDRSLVQQKLIARLSSIFGLLALLLADVGIYGVISYSVVQRSREIGVRMALGADRRDVLRLILGQGAKLVLAGALLGLSASWALTRWVESMLFNVSAADPATFLIITLSLIVVALSACYLPARRATKVDPLQALRNE